MSDIKKVVLAYSGGLDTSVILAWIKNTYNCEVVTLTADLGQGEELDGIEDKALKTGAVKAYVEDLQEEFARDFIFPMMRAGALYEGRYLLGTSIARPLISKRLVDIAHAEDCQAIAHGATGKGNDQVRFELAAAALDPKLVTIAPWREWDLTSRTDCLEYAAANGIEAPVSHAKPYSCDRNLLHCSFEGGELEDPWNSPAEYSYAMCVPVEQAPDEPEVITIDFEAGDPVAVNNERMSPAAIMIKLNELGGRHGIGRVDMVENRFVGMKSCGVYETPGGTVLFAAHRDLEGITLDREVMHLRDSLITRYSEMVYNGFWFAPERVALQALIDDTQKRVTGTVRLKLYKGQAIPLGRKSPYSLYREDLATFETDQVYNQADAAGFITLQGLRLRGYGTKGEQMADKKMWGGRFAEGTAASVEEYTESQSYDRVLYEEDIQGSMAHARMLARQGVITTEEAEAIVDGLARVRDEIESGEFVWKRELEDVHMNVESRLTELIGPLGGKLHTGRSRNDQVAVDFRLHVARRLDEWQDLLAALVSVIADKADAHRSVLLPGCTHFQPAQPVSLAQHLLAYAQMFKRDFERAADCAKRTRISPLGAAALAGTTYPLDPASVAAELGMDASFANSMDAVSDRDFAIEAVFTASLVMAHLSRLCEEIIIWANPAFGFVALPDAYATGSSIMPQKKNPDVCELMRGKTGRVYGSLTTLMTLVKGLPLTYNRDMQEDKEPFFDADRTVRASLSIMADMLEQMGFNEEPMRKALSRGFLNATELADYLVGKGLPFREAHHVSGAAVGHAERAGKGLEDLTLDELKSFSDLIEEDVMEVLSYEAAVARREAPGGTGPGSVNAQIESLTAWIDSLK